MGGFGRRHPGALRWSTQAGFAVAVVHRLLDKVFRVGTGFHHVTL